MPYADLPGVRLWYEDSGGSGPPVVFLHAFSGTSQSWVYQIPAFAAAGYRCIAADRREWGRSTPDPAAPAARTDTEDMDALLNLLGPERLHLVATAAGAVTAFDYALTHPERVRSLVVANTVGGVQDEAYMEVQHRLRPAEIQALPVFLRELSAGYRGTNPEGVRRWVEIEHSSRPADMPWGGRLPDQPLTLARLATLAAPVLVVAGEADLLTPPAFMRLLAAPIPDHRFVTVLEAGHAGHWEQPEVWNRLVLDFLKEH